MRLPDKGRESSKPAKSNPERSLLSLNTPSFQAASGRKRCIENAKRLTPERRARMAELDALLADEHALARQWMGCARTAEARA